MMKAVQLLINRIMLHYTWTLWTLLHHKIALNRSFPTVLLILNLVERLESYNQIFGWTLHGPSMDPHGPSVGNGFFSLSFDSMDMKLIPPERQVKGLSVDINLISGEWIVAE